MAKGTRSTRILLLALGIMVILSFGLAARSTWSYSLSSNEANAFELFGRFTAISSGKTGGLEISIINPTDSLLTILWDESVMVLPDGTSERIIHTGVRIIDKAAPQAPTAIAPSSTTRETVWPAAHVTTNDYFPTTSIPLWNNCTILLYLTVQDATGQKTTENWTWLFTETEVPREPREPFNWWLWGPIIIVLMALGLVGSMIEQANL